MISSKVGGSLSFCRYELVVSRRDRMADNEPSRDRPVLTALIVNLPSMILAVAALITAIR